MKLTVTQKKVIEMLKTGWILKCKENSLSDQRAWLQDDKQNTKPLRWITFDSLKTLGLVEFESMRYPISTYKLTAKGKE